MGGVTKGDDARPLVRPTHWPAGLATSAPLPGRGGLKAEAVSAMRVRRHERV